MLSIGVDLLRLAMWLSSSRSSKTRIYQAIACIYSRIARVMVSLPTLETILTPAELAGFDIAKVSPLSLGLTHHLLYSGAGVTNSCSIIFTLQ